MTRILLVEDEKNIYQALKDYLSNEGFSVTCASTCEEANTLVKQNPELVLLDWMLPDGQGIELLKTWRKEGLLFPVIFLTARTDLVDKVLGLELGANDYMTKPFEPRELLSRIRVQLRTQTKSPTLKKRIESSGISIDLSTREAFFEGVKMDLRKIEFELLRLFLENPNQVFSREELLKKIWGFENAPTTRTVDTHILQLRQKTKTEFFETVHGIGYRFRPSKEFSNG